MSSFFFIMCITKPTQIVSHNIPFLAGKIFVNIMIRPILMGTYLQDKITDHLPNFIVIKNLSEAPYEED